MPLLRLTLGDKLDKVQHLAMQEQEYVFNLQGALAEPWVHAHVKLLCNSRLKLTALIIILLRNRLLGCFLLLGRSCVHTVDCKGVFGDEVEAEEVFIELLVFDFA